MGPETNLFTIALGLQAPWSVSDVRFDTKAKEIHFEIRFKLGTRFACPSCGAADQPVHDTRPRTWEHLRFFVRRAEVRAEPALKRSRWMWLKDKKKWTKKQIAQHHTLSRMQLKTGRAFRMKEALRDIFAAATTRAEAEERLTAWFRWARRSKLAPFKKLALTLKTHWDGILNSFESALSNGSVEAINGLIQAAKARARGYRKPRNLILMAYLISGKLRHLQASPYTTTSRAIVE